MAVTTNLKTYEPFADMVRASPMFDLAGLFDFPRTRLRLSDAAQRARTSGWTSQKTPTRIA